MSIAIVTVFLLFWLPYSINVLIIQYHASSTHFSCSFGLYYNVTITMTFGCCAINPIIYFVFSSNYRQALKRLIKFSFLEP